MRQFFKGWKRKIGVVTLLMACVFLAGWIRGQDDEAENEIDFAFRGDSYVLLLSPAEICVVKCLYGQSEFGEFMALQRVASIPHWYIVIPLTLMSIWLLLSKPRLSTSKKTPEPIADEGATL